MFGNTKGFSADQPLDSSEEPPRNPCDAGDLGLFHTQGNGSNRRIVGFISTENSDLWIQGVVPLTCYGN